jgi:cell wall-associated NlpC family hydrolase
MTKLNVAQLVDDANDALGHVTYQWGGKPSPLIPPEHLTGCDCSGFVRYLLLRNSNAEIPDGSANQHEWAAAHCKPIANYQDLRYTVHDAGRLFIAFEYPPRPIGHVWLVCSGHAIECHGPGGHVMRNWRLWNDAILSRIETGCFELPAC